MQIQLSGKRTITLADSPGNYTVEATIDGTTSLNQTIEYHAPGLDLEAAHECRAAATTLLL